MYTDSNVINIRSKFMLAWYKNKIPLFFTANKTFLGFLIDISFLQLCIYL